MDAPADNIVYFLENGNSIQIAEFERRLDTLGYSIVRKNEKPKDPVDIERLTSLIKGADAGLQGVMMIIEEARRGLDK